MSSKTKIIVLHMKEVVYTTVFLALAIFFSQLFSEICYRDRLHYILILGQKKDCPKIIFGICMLRNFLS